MVVEDLRAVLEWDQELSEELKTPKALPFKNDVWMSNMKGFSPETWN